MMNWWKSMQYMTTQKSSGVSPKDNRGKRNYQPKAKSQNLR